MELKSHILITFIVLTIEFNSAQIAEVSDGRLNFTYIAAKYKLKVVEYDVDTEDGYILKLFRIPGDLNRPVLLVHGVLNSCYTFIVRGSRSIAYKLAEAGHDVWLINLRGVTHSRRHNKYTSRNSKFWDFSFHDMGYYDLPATIDFVLKETGQKKISAVGHSQGNTVFYVLGATRPEYNEKIKIMVALAPVCYLSHLKSPLTNLIEIGPFLNELFISAKQEEIFDEEYFYNIIVNAICKTPGIGYRVCGGLLFEFAGEDQDELTPEIYYKVVEHFPTSISRKNAIHLMQTATSKEFAMFDYGREKNKGVYGTLMPPKYDLSKVTMKVAMFIGKNDKFTPIKDVYRLRDSLLNVVEFRLMEREKFNHLDFIWGKNIHKYLIPHLLNVLSRFM